MRKRILFLDDVRTPEQVLGALVPKGNSVHLCRSSDEAARVVADQDPFDVWRLDYDLNMEVLDAKGTIVTAGYTEPPAPNGLDFLKWAAEHAKDKWPVGQVYVHSANPEGQAKMRAFIQRVEEGGP
jgi:CheY-like chemotaxis protein